MRIVNEDGISEPKEGMSALIVPDGFDYENYYSSNLEITFPEKQNELIYIEVLNGSILNGASSLFSDQFKGYYNKELLLPLHVTELSVMATYKNRIKIFGVGGPSGFKLTLSQESFKSTVDTTNHSNGRIAAINGKDNCLPEELGVYYPEDISWSDDYVVAYSSIKISKVVLQYADGSEEEVKKPVYDYEYYWYFNYDTSKEIAGVWVKSGCNDDDNKKGWFVENPHYSAVVDSDNDGIEDAQDADPDNAAVAKKVYHPAQEEYNTLAFEDLWPYKGDFDFNDFIVSINRTISLDANDKVSVVAYKFRLRAIGASFSNDFCVGFTDINETATVDVTSNKSLNHNTRSSGQWTEVRFPSIKDVFGSVGFVNTQTDRDSAEVVTFEITATLDRTLSIDDFETDEYLRINGEEGREVHRPGKVASPWADVSMFQTGHDTSEPENNRYYLTQDNLPWVIEIPIEWNYPKEGAQIIDAYPNFKTYAQSNPDLVWYTSDSNNINSDQVYKN